MEDQLSQTVRKLGHQFEEVRLRALDTILSKLELNLVRRSELLGERELMAKLVGWFGWAEASHRKQVLALILALLQEEEGPPLLLRADPGLRTLKKAVINNYELERIYLDIELATKDYLPPTPPLHSDYTSTQEGLPENAVGPREFHCVEWRVLPVAPLTAADAHVLTAVANSLADPAQRAHATHFFTNVILKDFPPQLFLQRPAILKRLLGLVEAGDDDAVRNKVIWCLSELTRALHRSLLHHSQLAVCSFSPSLGGGELAEEPEGRGQSWAGRVQEDEGAGLSLAEYCAEVLVCGTGVGGGEAGNVSWLLTRALQLLGAVVGAGPGGMVSLWAAPKLATRLDTALVRAGVLLARSRAHPQPAHLAAALIVWRLLTALQPPPCHLPSELTTPLLAATFHPPLALHHPAIHHSLVRIAEDALGSEGRRSGQCLVVARSLEAGATLLTRPDSLSLEAALDLMEAALLGLQFHRQYQIVTAFIHQALNKWEVLGRSRERCEGVLVELLGSEDEGSVTAACRGLLEAGLEGPSWATSYPVLVALGRVTGGRGRPCGDVAEAVLARVVSGWRGGLSRTSWAGLVPDLLAALPLLEAVAPAGGPLAAALLALTHPDTGPGLGLPAPALLLASARLLFSTDPAARAEGWSRLAALADLPHPAELPDLSASTAPTGRPSALAVYQLDSLVRVLALAAAPDADPPLRASALAQLAVITEDHTLHGPFLHHHGLPTVLPFLHLATDPPSTPTKLQVLGSVLRVLRNVCWGSGACRHEVSQDAGALGRVTRALLTPGLDWRAQRDASQLLALLAFADLISSSPDVIALPDLIVAHTRLPFKATSTPPPPPPTIHSHHLTPGEVVEVLGDERVRRLLGVLWGAWAGGTAEWAGARLKADVEEAAGAEPGGRTAALLTALAAAPTHLAAHAALTKLRPALQLSIPPSGGSWPPALARFLRTVPSSAADLELLIHILHFLLEDLPRDELGWVASLLQEPPPLLAHCLQQCSDPDAQSLRKEAAVRLLEVVEVVVGRAGGGWARVAALLLQALDQSHTHKFYGLAVVERVVGVLRALAARGEGGLRPGPLWGLLPAFHAASPASYMGRTITRHTLLTLADLVPAGGSAEAGPWLVPELRWVGRVLEAEDPVLRAAGLQLLARVAALGSGPPFLRQLLPELWRTAVDLLTDPAEVSLVREQAAVLATNLHTVADLTDLADLPDILAAISLMVPRLSFSARLSAAQRSRLQLIHSSPVGLGGWLPEAAEDSWSPVRAELLEAACELVSGLGAVAEEQATVRVLGAALVEWWGGADCLTKPPSLYTAMAKVLLLAPAALPAPGPALNTAASLLTHYGALLRHKPESGGGEVAEGVVEASLRLMASLLSEHKELVVTAGAELVAVLRDSIQGPSPSLSQAALYLLPLLAPHLTSGVDLLVRAVLALLGVSPTGQVVSEAALRDGPHLRAAKASLTGLLSCSGATSAASAALTGGLVPLLLLRLRDTHLQLSVLPLNTPRHSKCNELLSGLWWDVGLACGLAACGPEAQAALAAAGLADALHKVWAWCLLDSKLLAAILRTLVTFTAHHPPAAGTLVLTSTIVGVGQRKSATSSSLVHAMLGLLPKDVYPGSLRRLALLALGHAAQAPDSRLVLAKSALVPQFARLGQAKRSPTLDQLELGYLHLLTTLASFPDALPLLLKEELVQRLVGCLASPRQPSRQAALGLLRNLTFHPASRHRLYSNQAVLRVLSSKLEDNRTTEAELEDVAVTVWSLAANSQRAKQSLKAAGLPGRLQLALAGLHQPRARAAAAQALALIPPT